MSQQCTCASAGAVLLQTIGRSLDITSCLSARLVCSSWCDGVSSSIVSLLLTPALLATLGPEPLKRCLNRLAHLENIDLALTSNAALGKQRSYNAEHVQQLLELLSQHCQQKKLPALFAFTEQLPAPRVVELGLFGAAMPAANAAAAAPAANGVASLEQQQKQQLASWQQQGLGQGLQELGPKLTSMRLSNLNILNSATLSQLTRLEHLELNLQRGSGINWRDLAQLPALHSLILAPPVSPSSSGLGPEHAQQVVPTLLSFSIPVKDLLEGLTASPAGAARMKQLLIQQTGSWDARAVELLSEFKSLEVLRLFPGPTQREDMWDNLAPVSGLVKLQELQLVGYSPVNFSNGSATGESGQHCDTLHCHLAGVRYCLRCCLRRPDIQQQTIQHQSAAAAQVWCGIWRSCFFMQSAGLCAGRRGPLTRHVNYFAAKCSICFRVLCCFVCFCCHVCLQARPCQLPCWTCIH
jgi:hypothetical protein